MSVLDHLLVRSLPLVPRAIVGRVARPYVAGAGVEDAVRSVRALNARGILATLDILGEHVRERREAESATAAYVELLDAIASERLDSNVSLKLTQLGLALDRKLAADNLRAVVGHAARHGNFVRIDMEDASTTDATLDLFAELRGERDNLGVVLQAMLHRTLGDAERLAAMRANVRVCKGIYLEPPEIAWRDRERIRESFLATVETLLRGGSFVAIATHDDVLVEACLALVDRLGLPRIGRYEFQMLLGVRERLRDAIVARGHRLRVYVPFGAHWYAYSLRRLRENPTIARHVLRALVLGE